MHIFYVKGVHLQSINSWQVSVLQSLIVSHFTNRTTSVHILITSLLNCYNHFLTCLPASCFLVSASLSSHVSCSLLCTFCVPALGMACSVDERKFHASTFLCDTARNWNHPLLISFILADWLPCVCEHSLSPLAPLPPAFDFITWW